MKMNRKDIPLKTTDFIKELKRELTMRWAVYTKEVQQKRLSPYEANKRYLIILELRELMEAADSKGLSLQDLKDLIAHLQPPATPKQRTLFTNTKFPN